MRTESKKDHDKDNQPGGEAAGADLVSRPEKNERGGSAPGAELAPRPETGPKAPTAQDETPAANTSLDAGGKRGKVEAKEDTAPLAGTRGGESRNTDPIAAGCIRCRVTGGAIKYHGRFIEAGTIADFDEKTVRELPDTLKPVRDDGSDCPNCTVENGNVVKPCLDHYVKAGYPAETYDRRFGSRG